MPQPTETKSYTPGAERAARQVVNGCIDGATELDYSANAALISRETHDAEMLRELKSVVSYGFGPESCKRITALIAKVEGQ